MAAAGFKKPGVFFAWLFLFGEFFRFFNAGRIKKLSLPQ
jgi:hypothetical protein